MAFEHRVISPSTQLAWWEFAPVLVEGVTTTMTTIVAPSSSVTAAMSSEGASAT
jgi:hypothetical protein